MSANPFDQFDAPTAAPSTAAAPATKSKGNPFDQFDAPSAVSPSATAQAPASGDQGPDYFSVENQLGPFAPLFGYKRRTPVDTPADMLQHMADIGRVAASQVGIGSALGNDPTAAQQRLAGTPYAGAGEVLGGAALGGAGEALGVGAGISDAATPYVGRFLANRAAGAIEQGGIGALTAAGNNQDPTQAGGINAIAGGVLGPFSKLGGGATAAAPALTSDVLKGQAADAFKPLDTNYFNTHGDALTDVTNTLKKQRDPLNQGVDLNIPPEVETIRDKLVANPIVTGSNIQKAAADLRATGSPEGNRYADALVGNATTGQQPWGAMKGMLAEHTPIQAGGVRGAAGDAYAQGNALYGQSQDLGRLEDMQAKAALPNAPGVGSQVSQWLQSRTGQQFGLQNSQNEAAWKTLAGMGKPATAADLMPSMWDVRHALVYPALAVGGGMMSGRQQDPAAIAEELAGGFAAGYGLHRLGPYAVSPFQRAFQEAKLSAAKQTLGAGAPFKVGRAALPGSGIAQALRTLSAAYGATGR